MQVAMRCHQCAPVETDQVEHWLWSEPDRLRSQASGAILRMQRLSQPAPTGRLDVGWFVEVEAAEGDALAGMHALDEVLRDMRLLGRHAAAGRTASISNRRCRPPGSSTRTTEPRLRPSIAVPSGEAADTPV